MDRAPAPQITLRETTAAGAVPLLAPAGRYDTTDGAETVERVAQAGRTFVVSQDGRDVLAYCLQRQGDEVYVLAAAGTADFDLTALGLVLIEAQARGAASVAFQTCRPGLIRKASRHGYKIEGRVANGVIMRKVLR
ncbi:hypothetical protein [Burkholderia gladioli]|uniref:hypothetical protein n=1 Tax=Burkholderia gladioli TaxID=28095 RepID=UPI00164110D3|nr:hypothetical protein [Burkholderia gladioli]